MRSVARDSSPLGSRSGVLLGEEPTFLTEGKRCGADRPLAQGRSQPPPHELWPASRLGARASALPRWSRHGSPRLRGAKHPPTDSRAPRVKLPGPSCRQVQEHCGPAHGRQPSHQTAAKKKVMNVTIALAGAILSTLLVGCSTSSGSITAEEQLAVHVGSRGEMHAALDDLEGSFEATSCYWPRPGSSPRVSTGQMTGAWNLEELVMTCEYQGELLEAPLQLTCSMTWDDIRSCYVGMWSQPEAGNILLTADGHVDPGGMIVTMRCQGETSVREVLEIESFDRHVRKVYRTLDSGEEYLSWQIEMVRATD